MTEFFLGKLFHLDHSFFSKHAHFQTGLTVPEGQEGHFLNYYLPSPPHTPNQIMVVSIQSAHLAQSLFFHFSKQINVAKYFSYIFHVDKAQWLQK